MTCSPRLFSHYQKPPCAMLWLRANRLCPMEGIRSRRKSLRASTHCRRDCGSEKRLRGFLRQARASHLPDPETLWLERALPRLIALLELRNLSSDESVMEAALLPLCFHGH